MTRGVTPRTAPHVRRVICPGSYVVLYLLFAALLISSHLWLARLPYFWDEAGQFVPAALDLLRSGYWIPHSTLPNIHPPAVAAYLAGVWRIAGFYPESTRIGMLALASFGALAAFLLAIELTRETRGTPAFLAAALLCVSPIFYAQSMLAQLDAPAMLFTTLALLLFLQDHVRTSAGVCVVLVLVKETGLIAPLVLATWLARERRWREAAWFLAPILVLGAWIPVLAHHTGYWAGNPDFARYNVRDPLHPLRLLITLFRRVYFLTCANFHWIGAAAIIYAWRKSRIFRTRPWQIAASLTLAHVILFTLLGGAVLNRYLLPVLPIVLAAMAAAISILPRAQKMIASAVLLAGLASSNFINPPYPFPYEDNLAFADFVRLHADAADYIAHWHADPLVHTAWPMSAELSRPELGYVPAAVRVHTLPNLSPETLASLDWHRVQILVVFSREWDPRINWMRLSPLLKFWARQYHFVSNATTEEARSLVPFPLDQSFTRRGQWVHIYINPDLPRTTNQLVRIAAAR